MDTSDARPVIVLITAKTCSHCHTFRSKVWSDLKPRLETDGRLRIVEIDLETTESKPSTDHPQDLRRFIRWFPMLLVASGSSWNHAKKNPTAKLQATVFSGQVNGDHVTYQPGPPANRDTVFSWLEDELKNPGFVAVAQRPKVVFTNDGRPLGAQRPIDVVPTVGSVCKQRYRARNAY